MCNGDKNIEHLYLLPSQWINLLKYESTTDEIYENLQNASCMPIKFFVENNFDSWHPKTHSPRNYLQSLYFAALIQKCGEEKHYPFAEFRNGISRKVQDHLIMKG